MASHPSLSVKEVLLGKVVSVGGALKHLMVALFKPERYLSSIFYLHSAILKLKVLFESSSLRILCFYCTTATTVCFATVGFYFKQFCL